MPHRAVEGRAAVLSTMAALAHERFVHPRVRDLLARVEHHAAADPDAFTPADRALLRETRRDLDRATKVDKELVREIAEAESKALAAWQDARKASDFAAFAPHLRRLVELKRRVADAVGFAETRYDALLDEYESGMTVRTLAALFAELESALTPLVARVAGSKRLVDTSPLRRAVDPEVQKEFALDVVRAMGFDLDAGRIDRSAHPFCTGIHAGDVRLTWRSRDDDLRPALFGIIHEAGHGLYEQGLPAELARDPVGNAASLGVHESQSRLWENMVARSRPFWSRFLPALKARCPGRFDDVDVTAVFRAANEMKPSAIRVEADELTYNLHILLRFDLERALFADELSIDELPAAWNDGMKQRLGVAPSSDAEGVLQDIHWAMGAFGYFPTYTLGNLYAAELLAAARRELPDLDASIARGEFAPLLGFLRRTIHSRGCLVPPRRLIAEAVGHEPTAKPFLDYIRAKVEEIYG